MGPCFGEGLELVRGKALAPRLTGGLEIGVAMSGKRKGAGVSVWEAWRRKVGAWKRREPQETNGEGRRSREAARRGTRVTRRKADLAELGALEPGNVRRTREVHGQRTAWRWVGER